MATRGPTFYVNTLIALLTRPGMFYATRFGQVTTSQSLAILTVSGLFFAATGALLRPDSSPLTVGLILFINAIGMAAMGSAACYLALVTTADRRYSFKQLLSIFSLSSGAVLLIAWVPSAFLLTEPWKWWLIGTGMVKGLGMSRARAVVTVLLTFAGMVALIYALFPIVRQLSAHPV